MTKRGWMDGRSSSADIVPQCSRNIGTTWFENSHVIVMRNEFVTHTKNDHPNPREWSTKRRYVHPLFDWVAARTSVVNSQPWMTGGVVFVLVGYRCKRKLNFTLNTIKWDSVEEIPVGAADRTWHDTNQVGELGNSIISSCTINITAINWNWREAGEVESGHGTRWLWTGGRVDGVSDVVGRRKLYICRNHLLAVLLLWR